MQPFDADFFSVLVGVAERSPRRRMHHNIHQGPGDPCQRFFNAIAMDSYIRPHRHSLDPRHELLVAATGSFAVLEFDEAGVIKRAVPLAAGSAAATRPGAACAVEVAPGDWHTVVALEPSSVLLEVKAGPYVANAAKEFAPWSPQEGSPEARAYLASLRESLICS